MKTWVGIIAFAFSFWLISCNTEDELLEDVLPANNQWIFKIIIGVGVGIFLVIGLFRIVFQKSLSPNKRQSYGYKSTNFFYYRYTF